MIPRDLSGISLNRFPTHDKEFHSWLLISGRLRIESTSPAKLSVDGRHIPPGYLVFSLPPRPPEEHGK